MNNERRILRMQQTRQRSKEVAGKVLHNIRKEKKEIEEQTRISKKNGYLNWYKTIAEKNIIGNPDSVFDNELSIELRNSDGNSESGKKRVVKNVNKKKNKQPTYKQFRDEKEKKISSKSSNEKGKKTKPEKNKKLKKTDPKKNNPTMVCQNCKLIHSDISAISFSSESDSYESDSSKSVLSNLMSSSCSDSYEELRHEKRIKRKSNSEKKKEVKLTKTTPEIIEIISSPPVKETVNSSRRFTQVTDFIESHSKSTTPNERLNEQEPTTSASSKEVNDKVQKESVIRENPSLQTLYNREKTKTKNLQSDNKVQFYDYTNKFKTSYDRPVDIIQNSEILSEINAGHVADADLKREEIKKQNANILMQKSEQRSQKVLEMDKINRDVKYLTDKLAAVQNIMHRYCAGDVLSDVYMQKLENIKQGKMNGVIEEVLKRPVLITCPEVNVQSTATKSTDKNGIKSNTINVGKETKKSSLQRKEKILDSSDSCASIILKPLEKETDNVIDTEVSDLDSSDLSLIIQNLENRIHKIKNSNGEIFDTRMKQYSNLAKFVLISLKEYKNFKGHNEEIEEMEKKFQKCIEQFQETNKKVQEFFNEKSENVRKGQKQDEGKSDTSEKKKNKKAERGHQKVEIVLKMQHENEQKNSKKSKSRNSRVRACLVNSTERNQAKSSRYKKKVPQVRLLTRDNFSTSTSYRSPPNQINTKLNKIIDNLQQSKDKEIQKEYLEEEKYPEMKRTSARVEKSKPKQGTWNQKGQKNINKIPLTTYVKRLLGMAPDSIKCLEVSSSEISTPNSIVNRKCNNNEQNEPELLKNVDLMSRFLQHSFHENSNGSLDNISQNSTLISAGFPTGRVWMDLLKYGQKNSLFQKSSLFTISSPVEISSCSDKSLKSILKNSSKMSEEKDNNKVQDELETINLTTPESKESNDKIAKLAKQLDKIKKEKEKLFEMPLLLNNGEDEEDCTEYLDLPSSRKISKVPAKETSKIQQEIRLEELEKISQEKNKATRVSHDSGISLSRPVTAQGSRGTPDIRTPEIINISINEENIDSGHCESSKLLKSMHTPTSSESDRTKKNKPPTSITRFSPQLTDIPPHELSTIVEVETPGTSVLQKDKITPRDSIKLEDNKEIQEPHEFENEESMDKSAYDLKVVESFRKILESCSNTNSTEKLNLPHWNLPTFEEFLKEKHLQLLKETSLSKSNISNSSVSSSFSDSIRRIINEFRVKHPFPKFEDLLKNNNLPTFEEFLEKRGLAKENIYKKTTDENTNCKSTKKNTDSTTNSQKSNSYEEDISRKENDVQDLGESDNVASSSIKSTSSSSSKQTSLPDIVAELLKRNISPHGFARFDDPVQDVQPTRLRSAGINKNSYVDNEKIEEEIYNRKKQEFIPPRRKRHFHLKESVHNKESTSSDSMHSEEIKEDLKAMGLEWASVMLQRSKISPSKRNENARKKLSQLNERSQPKFNKVKVASSTSQSNEKKSSTGVSSSQQTEEPFNLQSFIKRQLEKQIKPTPSDFLLSSSSLSESVTSNLSIYLPELSHSASIKEDNMKRTHTIEMQKASTPVSSTSTPKSSSGRIDRLFFY